MKTRQNTLKLLIFFGPVGVGKTTLANYLRLSLSKRGIRVKITFLKAFHGVSFILWVLIARVLRYGKKKRNKHYAPWLYVSQINEKLAWRLTLITAIIDTFLSIPFKLFYIDFLKHFYDIVICEEHLLGTVSDYLFTLLRNKRRRGSSILRFSTSVYLSMLSRHIQKTVVVFLDADFHTLFSRWNMRKYGESQHSYILYQKLLLTKFIKLIHTLNIDAHLMYIDTSNKVITKMISELMSHLLLLRFKIYSLD